MPLVGRLPVRVGSYNSAVDIPLRPHPASRKPVGAPPAATKTPKVTLRQRLTWQRGPQQGGQPPAILIADQRQDGYAGTAEPFQDTAATGLGYL